MNLPWRLGLKHSQNESMTNRTLLEAATKAAAELRHAYRCKDDWNLVSRAIVILEKATTEATTREWHGCIDPQGHSFAEGVCQTEGCGMDLRDEGGLIDKAKDFVCGGCGSKGFGPGTTCYICNSDWIPEPTRKELLARSRAKDNKCVICPPNRGENASRKPKHESKPKRKNKR